VSDNRVDQLLEAVAELKALMPEAHAAIKDLRAVIKEAKQVAAGCAEQEVRERVVAAVHKGLEELTGATATAMEMSVSKVIGEFTKLEATLLGFDAKDGRPTIPQIVQRMADMAELKRARQS
jgi:hypothetical protein